MSNTMLDKKFSFSTLAAPFSVKAGALAVSLVLASCASTPLQLPTQADVDTARQNGTLETMFADLNLRAKLDPNAAKLSKRIGEMIASDKVAAVKSELDASRVADVIPVALLNTKAPLVKSISKFNTTIAKGFSEFLGQENQKTQTVIRSANAVITDSSATITAQLEAADTVAKLKAEDPEATKATLLSNAYNVANNLEVSGDYEAAAEKWLMLAEAAPDFKDVQQRLEAVSGTFQLDKFNGYLAAGEVDAASVMYVDLASKGVNMDDFADGWQQLVAYYQLNIEAALDEERLVAAVDDAQTIISLEKAAGISYTNDTVTTVVESLILRSETYSALDKTGLSLGVLLAAEALSPSDPLVTEMMAGLNDKLLDKSITRLSLGTFSGTENYPQIGNRISSLIKEQLIAEKLDAIKLIERDKLQAVFVEKELLAMKGGEVNTTVEPADIVVQGEVLSASVDENRSSKRKTKRVVVEIEKTPNPAYQEWFGFSDSKKRKFPEPPQFLENKVKEDIQINSEIVRVEGFLSASYRLINPVTATIMSYQSLEETANYEGETTEGIEIGLFVQEGSVADVPGASQIIAELSETVANNVAQDLSSRFADPVGLFLSEANAYLEKDDDANAALSLGKAYSYSLNKGAVPSDITAELQRISLGSEAYLED